MCQADEKAATIPNKQTLIKLNSFPFLLLNSQLATDMNSESFCHHNLTPPTTSLWNFLIWQPIRETIRLLWFTILMTSRSPKYFHYVDLIFNGMLFSTLDFLNILTGWSAFINGIQYMPFPARVPWNIPA